MDDIKTGLEVDDGTVFSIGDEFVDDSLDYDDEADNADGDKVPLY